MNLIDRCVVLILAFYVLAGIYRGFLPTVLSLISNVVSWGTAMLFMPLMANAVKANAGMFNMLLYYSEGSEFIGDVELARTSVDALSSSQVASVIEGSGLPYPFAKEIQQNIANRAFQNINISTLGDYFNQTIVCVVINIIVFIIIFAIVRIILGLIINGTDYAIKLPRLRQYDSLTGAGFGLIRGIMALFVIFMVVPLILIAMDFDFIHQILNSSLFAPFFYHSSILLSMIPGA